MYFAPQMKASNTPSNYMPQLDGLRTIAVGLVIISHWIPSLAIFRQGAHIGVHLFFILSGFLITGILLESRQKAENLGLGVGSILKGFYARRFLRIFPLYYAVLFIMYAAGAPNVVDYFSWHLLYLTNFKVDQVGWVGEASHLWSLAVEEQFYLVWPFVMLFAPRRYLIHAVVVFIIVSPAFQFFGGMYGTHQSISSLPMSCFHSLGGGALLSFLSLSDVSLKKKAYYLLAISAAIYAGISLSGNTLTAVLFIKESALTITLMSIVYLCGSGMNNLAGSFLSTAPMLYLGKISYGLYILHNFVPYTSSLFLNKMGFSPMATFGPIGFIAINLVVLIILASLSWYLFESRINTFKKHFPYLPRKGSLQTETVIVQSK